MAFGRAIKAGAAYVELTVNDSKLMKGLRGAEARLQAFGGKLRSIGAGMVGIGAGFAAGLAPMIKIASDAEEGLNRFNAVFGEQTGAASKFVDKLAKDVGRSSIDIRDSMSSFQGMFVGLDFDPSEARAMSQELQALALDFASFNNLSDAEANERFIAGLSGSSEVFDRFGINIKSAALEQKLLEMGINKSTAQASEQEKVMARLAIIMESMGKQGAIGDAVKTADSFANQLKRLGSQAKDAAASIGKSLIPVIAPLLKKITDVAGRIAAWIKENPELVQTIVKIGMAVGAAGIALLAFGIVLSGLGFVFGTLASAIGLIFTPGGLIAVAAAAILAFSGKGGDAVDWLGEKFKGLKDTAATAFGGISDALKAGKIELAFRVLGEALKVVWAQIISGLEEMWNGFLERMTVEIAGVELRLARLFPGGPSPEDRVLVAEEKLGKVVEEARRAKVQAALDPLGRTLAEFGHGPDEIFTKQDAQILLDSIAAFKADKQKELDLFNDLTKTVDAAEANAKRAAAAAAAAVPQQEALQRGRQAAQANIGAVLGTDAGTRAMSAAFRGQGLDPQAEERRLIKQQLKEQKRQGKIMEDIRDELEGTDLIKDERV